MIKNKISSIFGPTGSAAGTIFFGIGVLALFYTWIALFIVLIGALLGFSKVIVLIDPKKRRVKWCEYYFGIIPTGKWLSIEDSMILGYKHTNDGWSAKSLSNRQMDVPDTNYTIILHDQNDQPIFPLVKVKTEVEMKEKIEVLSTLLHIPI